MFSIQQQSFCRCSSKHISVTKAQNILHLNHCTNGTRLITDFRTISLIPGKLDVILTLNLR